jgi:hypothetical protein
MIWFEAGHVECESITTHSIGTRMSKIRQRGEIQPEIKMTRGRIVGSAMIVIRFTE